MGVTISPLGFWQLVPIPFDFLSRWMVDLDGGASLHARTRLTVRTKTSRANAPGKARIAEGESKSADLVIQGAGPYVRILVQPLTQVGELSCRALPGGSKATTPMQRFEPHTTSANDSQMPS